MQRDKIRSEPSVKKIVKPGWDKHRERSDRRKLKLEDGVYLWNISPAAATKQPINFSLSVLQAPVRDSGVPRKVLPLHESRGGGASFWHRVQAETGCGPRDQNPCPTGAVLWKTSLFEAINVSKLRVLKMVCYLEETGWVVSHLIISAS